MLIQHSAVDRRAKANELRDAKFTAGYSWKGAVFQIDSASRGAIAARALKAYRNPEPVTWRTIANEEYPFSAEDFLAFADAVDDYAESLVKECWALKAN